MLITVEPAAQLACDWCAKHFERPHHIGRIPRYCTRTCRQRAYEHRRRGAPWPGKPTPPNLPPPPYGSHIYAPYYEGGSTLQGRITRHGVRPYVPPDARGMRVTLCGTKIRVTKAPFSWLDPDACKTCAHIAYTFKPSWTINASNDLATLLAQLETTRQHARELSNQPGAQHTATLLQQLYEHARLYTGIGDPRIPPHLRRAI